MILIQRSSHKSNFRKRSHHLPNQSRSGIALHIATPSRGLQDQANEEGGERERVPSTSPRADPPASGPPSSSCMSDLGSYSDPSTARRVRPCIFEACNRFSPQHCRGLPASALHQGSPSPTSECAGFAHRPPPRLLPAERRRDLFVNLPRCSYFSNLTTFKICGWGFIISEIAISKGFRNYGFMLMPTSNWQNSSISMMHPGLNPGSAMKLERDTRCLLQIDFIIVYSRVL